MTGRRLLSPLGVRLAAAFITVALAAVAVFAALTLSSARSEVAALVQEIHREDASAAATAAARAYAAAGGWQGADLSSAAAIAARGQASLVLRDAGGEILAAPSHDAAEMMAEMHGVTIVDVPRDAVVAAPVVADGNRVGSVELRFPSSHLPGPQREIRDALSRNALLGAALATVAATGVAVFVARRVSRPITSLTEAAIAVESGRRDVRVELDDAPGELGALAAAFDRMSAAVARADDARRQLVADVAHELRTPLTILRGTTEALVDGVTEPDEATLASLHDEVLRLTHLVGDLETLAAADAAELHLHPEPLDLSDLAATVAELAASSAAAAGLTVLTDLSPAPVVGDEGRLRQVLTTLVANALAYTPPGGRVTIRTGEDAHRALLEVSDTGPGIDDADLPHVFDRFYRGRRTAGVSGTGIGLAIARELVAAHDGSIEAANAEDGGARLVVRLPRGR